MHIYICQMPFGQSRGTLCLSITKMLAHFVLAKLTTYAIISLKLPMLQWTAKPELVSVRYGELFWLLIAAHRRLTRWPTPSHFLFPSSSIRGSAKLSPVRKNLPAASRWFWQSEPQLWPFPPPGKPWSKVASVCACVCVAIIKRCGCGCGCCPDN